MNHEELLAKINDVGHSVEYGHGIDTSRIVKQLSALRAVVELHRVQPTTIPGDPKCDACSGLDWEDYPCPTIQVIEKELQ